MQHLTLRQNFFTSSLVALFFMMNTVSADEKVKFESDAQLQKVFKVGDKWECKWKNSAPATGSGTKTYTYEKVSLNKMTANVVNSFCPDNVGVLYGQYKKGKIMGVLKQSRPCIDTTKGHYITYKKKDGCFYTKGPYSFNWIDGNTYKGNTVCHLK